MSGNSAAAKSTSTSTEPLVQLIRVLAVCVVFIGILQLFLGLPDLALQVSQSRESMARKFAIILGSLSGPLHVASIGAIAHVVTQITFGRCKRRTPFDFQGTVGKHIDFERPTKAFNRWFLGGMCLVGGALLSLTGNAIGRSGGPDEDPLRGLLLFAFAAAIVVTAMLVFLMGLRSLAPRAETLLKRARRRPILYLRSFKSDAGLFDRFSIGNLFKMLIFGPLANQTTEQSLSLAVKDFRPLVAIGQPGERLPPLGAARLYVSGDDWQTVVANLVDSSTLVILRIGSTEGFWWEIEHLAKTCDPLKILVYLPPKDRGAVYQQWRDRAAGHFPHPLPSGPGKAMFLAFGPDWKPYLLGKYGPSLGAGFRQLLGGRAPEVREALNIHLRRLGAKPTRLPLLAREWFLMILVLLLILVFVAIPIMETYQPIIMPTPYGFEP